MKIVAQSFLAAAAFATALVGTALQAAVETGKPAPDFQLTDTTGKQVKLSDYKGKVVVLEWTNSACPVVQRHYNTGNMQATQKAATADGVVWLQICSNAKGASGDLDDQKANAWLKKVNASSTAYLRDPSGRVGRLYNAKATPHLFVINKDGTLAYQGAIDDRPSASAAETTKANNFVKAALAALKDGKPVPRANTQAYGCAIKYAKES